MRLCPRRREHRAPRRGNALHTIKLCNIIPGERTYVCKGHWDFYLGCGYNVRQPSSKSSVGFCGRIRPRLTCCCPRCCCPRRRQSTSSIDATGHGWGFRVERGVLSKSKDVVSEGQIQVVFHTHAEEPEELFLDGQATTPLRRVSNGCLF